MGNQRFHLIFLICFLPILGMAHMEATYRIYEVNKQLKMEMAMGEHHIIEAIEKQYPFLKNNPSQEEIDDCVVEYIDNNMDIDFNDEETNFRYQTIASRHGYVIIHGAFDLAADQIESAKIENTILVDEVAHHSNIMEFDLPNMKRSFRLHKERRKTFFQQNNKN